MTDRIREVDTAYTQVGVDDVEDGPRKRHASVLSYAEASRGGQVFRLIALVLKAPVVAEVRGLEHRQGRGVAVSRGGQALEDGSQLDIAKELEERSRGVLT